MNDKLKGSVIGGGFVLLLVILDQVTKWLAVAKLMNQPAISIIKGVFELQYVENRGAAFGVMQGRQGFFLAATIVVVIYLTMVLLRLPSGKHYLLLRICLVGIIAGALGNFVDRVVNGYVVDFLYFSLIDFPVFNVADCYVTIGAMLLVYAIMFAYKEEDMMVFALKKKSSQSSEGV